VCSSVGGATGITESAYGARFRQRGCSKCGMNARSAWTAAGMSARRRFPKRGGASQAETIACAPPVGAGLGFFFVGHHAAARSCLSAPRRMNRCRAGNTWEDGPPGEHQSDTTATFEEAPRRFRARVAGVFIEPHRGRFSVVSQFEFFAPEPRLSYSRMGEVSLPCRDR
jgi:hypothetical protein